MTRGGMREEDRDDDSKQTDDTGTSPTRPKIAKTKLVSLK